MIFEYISVILAIVAGIAASLAWVYRRGKSAGIDATCGKRIEDKIDKMKEEGDKVHGELKKEIHEIHSQVDKLVGSFATFKELFSAKF